MEVRPEAKAEAVRKPEAEERALAETEPAEEAERSVSEPGAKPAGGERRSEWEECKAETKPEPEAGVEVAHEDQPEQDQEED
uniref:Uncharacterized protein n=1 Tax=candidate division WWE3 bacterium TaxID=2053526 RepID=A0A831YZ73_UNCKA